MLVFVVVLPSEAAAEYVKDTRLRGLFRTPPPDFCVVNNNLHQLPIGTLRFKSVQHHTLDWSFQQKQLLAKLNQELKDKTATLEETTTKAKIIQHLISERIQDASETYSKDRKKLLKTSKREIAWYVHQKLEADVIPAYFKKHPKAFTLDEMEAAKIASVEETERAEADAKRRLDDQQEADETVVADNNNSSQAREKSRQEGLGGTV